MNREIVNAIEEQTGLQHSSLADAIHWYETPTAWRSDFMALWNHTPARGVKPSLRYHERTVKLMEHEILDALAEMSGERYKTIAVALEHHSRQEMLAEWLDFEMLYIDAKLLLQVLEVIGYDVDPDE